MMTDRTVRVNYETWEALRELSTLHRTTVNSIIVQLLNIGGEQLVNKDYGKEKFYRQRETAKKCLENLK